MAGLFETEARDTLRRCNDQTQRAMTELLHALEALDDLPPKVTCDREGDARHHARVALNEAFVRMYRVEFLSARTLNCP